MHYLTQILSFFIHLDVHLTEITTTYGTLTYAILFGVIFAETGFVITPFLPGDSLLFAGGAIAALGGLKLSWLIILMSFAAIIGDTVNYWIGHFFGKKMIANPRLPIKQEHIDKTEAFYKKHGGKTIILARFVPIVRTFAPFVAGIGTMDYKKFITYNIIGGITWVTLFSSLGYFFGNLPGVKHNFSLVIFGIIGLSVLPMIFEYIKSKKH